MFEYLGVSCSESAWPDEFGRRLRECISHARPIRTLSLFSGGGGLDIGFRDAGFDIAEAVEIEPACVKVLAHNARTQARGHSCVSACDIRDFKPSAESGYEFVIGGPPCQSFSAAGRRAAGVRGINDERGTLFEELCAS